MYLTFTDKAQERLQRYLGKDKKIILDYDDGVGPFSAMGNCSLDVNFKLVFVDKDMDLPDFDAHFDSNLGPVYYKGFDKPQYAEEMTLDFNKNFFTLPLKSPMGMLTDNVEVVDYEQEKQNQVVMNKTHDC